jgi:hypothetical protein
LVAAGLVAALGTAANADSVTTVFGGDTYLAGEAVTANEPVTHDAFMAGRTVTLSVPVTGDAHLAGYDVHVDADIGGDVYAAGFSVSIGGNVKGDVTAIGNSVTVRGATPVLGNVRAAGATVMVQSAVDGSLLVTGETVTLDGPVKGDLSFHGRTLSFGANARVDGKVMIHAPAAITVPEAVASADRVSFEQLTSPEYPAQFGQTAEIVVKGFWTAVGFTVLWWLLLVVVGAALIALAPALMGKLQVIATVRPFRRIGLGLLALAAVLGLVPVAAITLVGLLLVPFVLIFAALAWSAAYLAGVYFAGLRVASSFTPVASNLAKVVVLGVSLVAAGLLVMLPFLGWLITLLLVTYGMGVIAALIMTSWSNADRERLDVAKPKDAPDGVTIGG